MEQRMFSAELADIVVMLSKLKPYEEDRNHPGECPVVLLIHAVDVFAIRLAMLSGLLPKANVMAIKNIGELQVFFKKKGSRRRKILIQRSLLARYYTLVLQQGGDSVLPG